MGLNELAVAELCGAFEITVALGAVGRLPRFLEAFFELLEPRDEFLLFVPLGFEAGDLLLEPAEFLFDGGAPLL